MFCQSWEGSQSVGVPKGEEEAGSRRKRAAQKSKRSGISCNSLRVIDVHFTYASSLLHFPSLILS